jgi:hypothetical protein
MINAGDFGLPVSDLGNQQQGIANTYAGGININESWKKKTDLNASVQMSNIQLVTQRNSLRNNLLPGNNFTYQSDGDNERTTKQQRFNATIDHKIDEFHSVRVTPQLTLQQESQRLFNDFKSFTTSNDLLNSGFTQRNNQSQKVLFNNNVLLRKRFKKKGRTISSTLIFGYNQDKNNGELKTENSFYTAAQATRDSVFSQQNKAQTWASQFNGSITYTEKLGRRTLLEWTNYYVTNNGKSNRQTLDFNLQSGKFDIPNPSLTNNFSFQQEQKGTTFRLRSNFKRINASIATSAQLSSLVSENKSVASLLKQSFSDLLPSAGLRYAMNSKTSIVVNYITSLKMPTSIELQPVADFSDPLNIYKGNPDLKRSYIHHITANITTLNLPRGRNVFVMASLNKIDNAIVQSDMINASGQRVTTPVNVSGLVNALLSFNSGFAIRSIKSTINLGVGITHNESLSFVNGVKNKMISKGLSPSLNWNLNIDKKFILYASGRWNISKATYSLQTKLNNRFLQQVYSIETTNYLPANISITNNISYTINSGRFFGYNTKIPFWTANVSKSFLKNNRGEIKVTVYDILNQNVGINRIANQQFVEDVRYNVLKRYFTLSILYILNKSGKNAGGVIIQTQ